MKVFFSNILHTDDITEYGKWKLRNVNFRSSILGALNKQRPRGWTIVREARMSNLDKQRIASPQKGNGIEVMVLAAVGLRAPGDVIGAIREAPEMKGAGVRVC